MSSIKCLDRALDILELMYQNGGKMTLTEIATELSLYKSTVHRTLLTLEQKDFIQRDEFTGMYTLGARVFMMGMVAARSIPISKIARPHLLYLSQKYDELTDLSVLDRGIPGNSSNAIQNDFVVVFQQYQESTYSKTLITPSQCESSDVFIPAVYLCFMAYNQTIDIEQHIIKINKRSVRKKWQYDEMIKELSKIREIGYSYLEGDMKQGQLCIAAPIFDKSNALIAVLSVRGSKTKFQNTALESLINDIVTTANTITKLCS